MKIYTIYDSVAKEFGPIFEGKNDAVALRNVQIQLEQVPTTYRHEYELIKLGTFDRETGALQYHEAPLKIEIPEVESDE